MKKVVLAIAMSMLMMGCSSEKSAESKLDKAAAQLQAGDESGLKSIEEVATKYPETTAGKKAALVLQEIQSSKTRNREMAAKSDLKNLSTGFDYFFSELQHFPKNTDDYKKFMLASSATPAATGTVAKYQEQQDSKVTTTSKDVKAVALVSADGQTFEMCTYHVNGQMAYCRGENGAWIEVERNKGVIQELTSKGKPAGELDGLTLFVKN
jgi:hypothetical protein